VSQGDGDKFAAFREQKIAENEKDWDATFARCPLYCGGAIFLNDSGHGVVFRLLSFEGVPLC
jgi:hypothetical protein